MFIVSWNDPDTLAGETVDAAADRAVEALQRAIAENGELRDPRAMGRAIALAFGATVLWLVLLWGLLWASRRVGAALLRLAKAKAERVRIAGVQVLEQARAIRFLRGLVIAAFWFLALLITYGWIGRVLQLFPFTRPWGEHLEDFVLDTGGYIAGAIVGAVPGLVVAVIIFLVARFAIGVLSAFFDRVQRGVVRVGWLDVDTVRPTRRLVVLAAWLLALAMAYPYLPGANTDAFKGLSVLIGLMVSIGGASVVGQALSGLILTYNRTFRLGDYVRVGEHEGTVVELGMYQTRLRTGFGDELTLPNSLVLGAATTNYSRGLAADRFMVRANVTIGYDTPWRKTQAMLEEASRRTPGIASDPPPRVFQTALSDFYVEYRLTAWALPSDPSARAELRSMLHQNILDVFNEHGVQMMSPHYLGDPDKSKVVPPSRWFEAPARPRTDGNVAALGGEES